MVSLFIFIFLKEMVSLFVENCFDPYIICQRSKWVFTLEYKSDKAIKRIKHRYEKNNSTNSFNRQKIIKHITQELSSRYTHPWHQEKWYTRKVW